MLIYPSIPLIYIRLILSISVPYDVLRSCMDLISDLLRPGAPQPTDRPWSFSDLQSPPQSDPAERTATSRIYVSGNIVPAGLRPALNYIS